MTTLYYFSGTGNSLHVARGLQQRVPGSELVPIVGELARPAIRASAEVVGIVFPVHGMTLPVPVRLFLEKADLGSCRYLFAVGTRGGTICRGFDLADRILARKGKTLDAHFLLTVANNDPKLASYEQPTADTFAALEKALPGRLDEIAAAVRGRAVLREKDRDGVSFGLPPLVNGFMEWLVLFGMSFVSRVGVNDYFYADGKCDGCGTCRKVCLSGKVALVDGRPSWQPAVRCHLCYACLNYCPREAVQIKSKWYMKSLTPVKGRYPHPWATVSDIAAQKSTRGA